MSLLAILTAAIGLAYWGHRRSVEQGLQDAADALALAAAAQLRQVGLGSGNPLDYDVSDIAPTIFAGNLEEPYRSPQIEVQVRPHGSEHADVVAVELRLEYVGPLALGGVPTPLVKKAHAQLPSWTLGPGDWPIVLFLAHAAKPMADHGADTTRPLWDLTREAISAMVTRPLPIRPGVIIFRDARSHAERQPTGDVAMDRLPGSIFFGNPRLEAVEGGGQPAPRGPVGENELVEVDPRQGRAQVQGALARVPRASGLTNLQLALDHGSEMLDDTPSARRIVVLLTNDRISYLLPSNATLHCRHQFLGEAFPKCTFRVPGGGDPVALAQRQATEAAERLRTLPGGVSLHVVQIRAKGWGEMVRDLLGAGHVVQAVRQLLDGVVNVLFSQRINEEHGIPVEQSFLGGLAGGPGAAQGGDGRYLTHVEHPGDAGALLSALTEQVCRFDPLRGRDDSEDRGYSASHPHARFVFIRQQTDGSEMRLDLEAAEGEAGATYRLIPGKLTEISLSPVACTMLGSQRAQRQLVIRWGVPRLISEGDWLRAIQQGGTS